MFIVNFNNDLIIANGNLIIAILIFFNSNIFNRDRYFNQKNNFKVIICDIQILLIS